MFDPTVGRFMHEDPIRFEGGTSNLDEYCGNSPTNATDPSGLQSPIYASNAEKVAAVLTFGADRASKGKELADLALKATQKKFPRSKLHNDDADAWRHCFWSALMAVDPVLKPDYIIQAPIGDLDNVFCHNFKDFPYQIGFNHEEFGDRAGQPRIEYAMDMHNNNVGLIVGRGLGEKALVDDVIAACDNALKDGKLIWIVNNKLTAPAVYSIPGRTESKLVRTTLYSRPTLKEVLTDLDGDVEKIGPSKSPYDVEPFTGR